MNETYQKIKMSFTKEIFCELMHYEFARGFGASAGFKTKVGFKGIDGFLPGFDHVDSILCKKSLICTQKQSNIFYSNSALQKDFQYELTGSFSIYSDTSDSS